MPTLFRVALRAVLCIMQLVSEGIERRAPAAAPSRRPSIAYVVDRS